MKRSESELITPFDFSYDWYDALEEQKSGSSSSVPTISLKSISNAGEVRILFSDLFV